MMKILRFAKNAAVRDEGGRLAILNSVAQRLLPDYRLTWPQIDWWRNEEFNAFLDRFGERGGFNTHRRWALHQLLKLARDVPGDTAECGTYLGASSWLICHLGRPHHAFDSFEGLSVPLEQDGSHWSEGDLAVPEDMLRENLKGFDVTVHKGWIPDRFPDVGGRQFAFVHLDVDLYQPTRDSIEFFYPRMPPGAVLVCDDYGCTTCPGATKAIDEFMADKPEPVLALDAGGCFLIKK